MTLNVLRVGNSIVLVTIIVAIYDSIFILNWIELNWIKDFKSLSFFTSYVIGGARTRVWSSLLRRTSMGSHIPYLVFSVLYCSFFLITHLMFKVLVFKVLVFIQRFFHYIIILSISQLLLSFFLIYIKAYYFPSSSSHLLYLLKIPTHLHSLLIFLFHLQILNSFF